MDTTRIDHDARSMAGAVTSWMGAPLAAAVRRPVMLQHWRRLTFLHWPYPPPAVQALLPPGLEVETFDGAAWVGLVPFLMDGVRPPGVPPLPWASRFPETNVRTYALGRDGRGGPGSGRPTGGPSRLPRPAALAPPGRCWLRRRRGDGRAVRAGGARPARPLPDRPLPPL